MRLEKNPVWTFCSLALMALFALSNADAALLFQDRHTGANGEQVVYRFEANVQPAVAAIEQSKAVKAATTWATQYYGLRSMTVANAQERMMPTHFWLVALTTPERGKSDIYYAVVLPNGSLVEPQISRQNLSISANPVDVTKDTELVAPAKGLEIHGEIVFTYGWGKGLGCYGPFIPNPLWDLPYRPLH